MAEVSRDKVDEIIDKYEGKRGVLIQLLLDIQHELNWIPEESLRRVSNRLNIPVSHIYRIASFYTAMSLTPRGRHIVSICLGTACHVRGGPSILAETERLLNINAGETTPDMEFTMHRVNCLGCCALGPVMMIDGKYYGNLTRAKAKNVLTSYQQEPRCQS